jgi:RHS repeat-associated protein
MKNRILITLLLALWAFTGSAAISHIGTFFNLGAANPIPGTFTAQQDDQWAALPNTPNFVNTDVVGYIRLEFDYAFTQQTNTTFHHVYQIGYTWWDDQKLQYNGTVNLELSYDPNFGQNVLDRDAFYIPGAHKINITSLAIVDKATGAAVSLTTPPWDFETKVSYGVKIERFYEVPYGTSICPTSTAQDLDGDTKDDVLDITWTPPTPNNYAESYDLEYTFVDDYTTALGTYKTPSQIAYDFRNNSTRVNVINPSYRINLVFDHGYVIYRIRAVGRDQNDPTKLVYGEWSVFPAQGNDLGSLSPCPNSYYHVVDPHEGGLNWEYSVAFAEEGKHKEVISYYDGSNRNRQSVTQINSDDEIIVGESFYDYRGRKAVDVLPVPANSGSPVIKYHENFNMNSGGTLFTKDDFDLDQTGNSCQSDRVGMSPNSGASQYYSPNNPKTSVYADNLPDAFEYPYVQTEYTPDPTSRIRRQGGVGINHQLNSGHETQYFYGQPTQVELDRLFGSEVGYNHHYKKNMVIDPNGQISISYLDLKGRVIATALTGDAPDNVQSLSSGSGPTTLLTADLFAERPDGSSLVNRIKPEENAIVFNSYYLVSNDGSHTFNYDITPEEFSDPCISQNNICYDCVYDLEITVIDNCSNVRYQNTETIGSITIAACNGQGVTTNKNFMVNLEEGNYQIVKKLTVNQNAYLTYLNDYLARLNTCVLQYSDILNDEYARIDEKKCRVDCDECLDDLGSLDQYLLDERGTEADWKLEYENCLANCAYTDVCKIGLEAMLTDMSPGGQYAEWNFEDELNLAKFPLSILNPDHFLPKGYASGTGFVASWKTPKYWTGTQYIDGYYDEEGVRVVIPVAKLPDGTYFPEVDCADANSDGVPDCIEDGYAYPEELKNVEDFILFFNRHWAYSLLIYHPEYEYQDWCVKELSTRKNNWTHTSGEFDQWVLSTPTYQDAENETFILAGDPTNLLNLDPFFSSLGAGNSYSSRMSDYMSNYHNGLTMAQVASASALCPNWFGNNMPTTCYSGTGEFGHAGLTAAERDAQWEQFAIYYMEAKQRIVRDVVEKEINTGASYKKKSNGCIGNTRFMPRFTGKDFMQWWDDNNDDIICARKTVELYRGKETRMFFTYPALAKEDEFSTDYQFYAMTGICPNAKSTIDLVNEVVTAGQVYTANVKLDDYEMYDPNLYKMLSGFTDLNNNYLDIEWNASTIATDLDLTIGFSNPGGATLNCDEIKFTMPGGLSYDWSDLISMDVSTLVFKYSLTSTHHGELEADFDDDNDPLTEPVTIVIKVATCLEIFECTFKEFCPPSMYNMELFTFMNALAEPTIGSADLTGTNVTVYSSSGTNVYDDWLGQAVHNEMETKNGGAYSSLKWSWNGSGQFSLTTNSSVSINVEFTTYSGSFTHSDVSLIEYFENFRVDETNKEYGFYIDAWYTDPITSELTKVEIRGGVSDGILTDCSDPYITFCQGHAYDAGEALQQLLHEAVIIKGPTTLSGGGTWDITSYEPYANVLVADLGLAIPGTGTAEVYNYVVTPTDITFNISVDEGSGVYNVCDVKLQFTNDAFEDLFDFNDLQNISNIRVDAMRMTGAKGYYFFLEADFLDPVSLITHTFDIEGYTTCIPIKSCNCDGGAGGGGGGCDGLAVIIEAITKFNRNVFGNNASSHTLSYDMLAPGEYDCECATQYALYLENYTDAEEPMTFTEYQAIYCAPCDDWSLLTSAIDRYNSLNPSFTMQYPVAGDDFYCDCIDGYAQYLNTFKNDLTGAVSYEDFIQDTDSSCDPIDKLFPGDSCNPAIFFNQILVPLEAEYNSMGFTGPDATISIPYPPGVTCDCINKYHTYLYHYMLARKADQLANPSNEYHGNPTHPMDFATFVAQVPSCTEPPNCFQEYNTMYSLVNNRYSSKMYTGPGSLATKMEFDDTYDCNCFDAYLQYVVASGGDPVMSLDDYCNTSTGYWTNGGTLTKPSYSMIDDFPSDVWDAEPSIDLRDQIENMWAINTIEFEPVPTYGMAYHGPSVSEVLLTGTHTESKTGKRLRLPGRGGSRQSQMQTQAIKQGTAITVSSFDAPCFKVEIYEFPEIYLDYDCNKELRIMAEANAKQRYYQLQMDLTKKFRDAYMDKCLQAQEDFTVVQPFKDYHYTLYYYDQAGNLVRTVPPQGVVEITDPAELAQVINDRSNPHLDKLEYTSHFLTTTYTYNSLNQLVRQSVPDHDKMEIWEISDNSSGLEPNTTVVQIEYESEKVGYLVGKTNVDDYRIYKTEDGGHTWVKYNFLENESAIDIKLLGSNNGYALYGNNLIFKTTDNGTSWKLFDFSRTIHQNRNAMASLSTTNLVVGGETGELEYYNGTGWNITDPMTTGNSCVDITTTGNNTYYVLNDLNELYELDPTAGSGSQWTPRFVKNNLKSIGVSALSVVSGNDRFAGGKSGVWLKTSDGGANWELRLLPEASDVEQIFFANATHGILRLANGSLYITTDGENWNKASVAGGYNNFHIYDMASGLGYAVGDAGRMAKIDLLNAGNELKGIYHNTTKANLQSAYFLSNSHGLAYTSDGNILELKNMHIQPNLVATFTTGSALPADAKELYFASSTSGVALCTDNSVHPITISGTTYSLGSSTSGIADLGRVISSNLYAVKTTGEVVQAPTSTYAFTTAISASSSSGTALAIDLTSTSDVSVGGTLGRNDRYTGSWTPQSANNDAKVDLTHIASDGNQMVIGGKDGFWISNDNVLSSNWVQNGRGTTNDMVSVGVVSGAVKRGYAGSVEGEMQEADLSTGGTSIHSLPWSVNITAIEAVTNTDVRIGLDNGLILDFDGASFTQAYRTESAVRSIQVDGSTQVVGTQSGELYHSSGSTLDFTDWVLPSLNEMDCRRSYGSAAGVDGLLLRKGNNTYRWKVLPQLLDGGLLPIDAQAVYALTDATLIGTMTGEIYERNDDGTESFGFNGSGAPVVDLAQDRDGYYYALEQATFLYKSALPNDVTVWNPINLGSPFALPPQSMDISGDVAYVVGMNQSAVRITDLLTTPMFTPVTVSGSMSPTDFVEVEMYDMVRAYMVGTNGVLARTTGSNGNEMEQKDIQSYSGDVTAVGISDRNQIAFGGASGNSHSRIIDDWTNEISSRFTYDRLGRKVLSQNTHQFNMANVGHSYTTYDELGRIIEVGLIENAQLVNTLYNGPQIDDALLASWLSAGTKLEVTQTYYDNAFVATNILDQVNLINRVASVTYEDVYDGNNATYNSATHYTYDIHGYVSEMVQEIPELAMIGQDFKRIAYEYDIVSGNMNKVHYQDGEDDQYHFMYEYDSDNRVTHAYSSTNNQDWENDATYFYYPHGPLARIELGEEKVQGIDYAYTIHGWLKGVNSTQVQAHLDMGKDGMIGAPNVEIARDAFSFSLGYYDGDYTAINGLLPAANWLAATPSSSGLMMARNDLFNGNISHMVTSLSEAPANPFNYLPQAAAYQYDQLNRIKGMETFINLDLAGNTWQAGGNRNHYKSTYDYDAMGNISQLQRSSGLGGLYDLDDLSYVYPVNLAGELMKNRLAFVTDGAPSGTSTNDIEDQSTYAIGYDPLDETTWNYDYDELGNLISDKSEEIQDIEWTTYGKIRKITRTVSSSKPDLEFTYDPSGNRLSKRVTPKNGDPVVTYYYLHDARGNEISRYTWYPYLPPTHMPPQCAGQSGRLFERTEVILYGNNRLGVDHTQDTIVYEDTIGTPLMPPCDQYGQIYENRRVAGTKYYELTNHLGNVLTVITDRKFMIDYDTDGFRDYWVADIRQVTDYYPFGMQMESRSYTFNIGSYHYGFNGKDLDSELHGNGNAYDFGARIYDSRLGRWLSVDPKADLLEALSTYAFSNNSVIVMMDPNGEYPKLVITDKVTGYTVSYVYGSAGKRAIVVPTYEMILYDVDKKGNMTKVDSYNVTRDGWYRKKNGKLFNRAFEPKKKEQDLYTAVALDYPEPGLPALALRRHGSEKLPAEPFTEEDNDGLDQKRKKLDEATGVMIHIGGWYEKGGKKKLAGSYGCFGYVHPNLSKKSKEEAQKLADEFNKNGTLPVGTSTSNFGMKALMSKVADLRDKDKDNPGTIHVVVKKRKNVERRKKKY